MLMTSSDELDPRLKCKSKDRDDVLIYLLGPIDRFCSFLFFAFFASWLKFQYFK